jgi:ubiquinone/menaquinone biosynthesis C-methylase UbiE
MTAIAREELRVREAYARRAGQGRYSWFDAAHLYAMQEVERGVLRLIRAHGFSSLERARVLEIGCGTAVWLREFVKWGAAPGRLAGVDLLDDRVKQARDVSPTGVQLVCGSAASLQFEDASFDIVFQSLVFTSILDVEVRARVAAEMLRVVRPDGVILWYDYHVDNPSNPDVRAVTGRELQALFPRCAIRRRRVTLAPPLARLVAPRSRALYAAMSTVPLLKTHYLAAICPTAAI